MQFPNELLTQVHILLDKPISPQANKQLYQLLLHDNLPQQKLFPLLCLKFRVDLLIYLFLNNRYPSEQIINTTLNSILNNIVEYKIGEVIQVYILIMTKIQDDKRLLEIGYHQLIRLALKKTNLQVKQMLFELIRSNTDYLYRRKCKKVLMAIIKNYLNIFNKFLIYVPNYITIVQLILEVDKHSKKIMNQDNPERQPQLQQIFIDLSSLELSQIKNTIMLILRNTFNKINYFLLHRNCLNTLKKICEILNQFKIKQSQLHFTELDVGQICRIIDNFIDRKGTIDDARLAKSVWMKRYENLKKIKILKSQKYVNPSNAPSLILDSNHYEQPLLIQQVISKTNNYRLKYQVSPSQNQIQLPKLISVSNNYLRKGIGIGGGKTNLLSDKQKIQVKQQEKRNKNLYDGIIAKCFEQYQEQIQYHSFVDPKINQTEQQQPIVNDNSSNTKKLKKILSLKQKKKDTNEININWNQIPAFSSKQQQSIDHQFEESMLKSKSLMIQDDEEVQQINQLIDLAYSYKFT